MDKVMRLVTPRLQYIGQVAQRHETYSTVKLAGHIKELLCHIENMEREKVARQRELVALQDYLCGRGDGS